MIAKRMEGGYQLESPTINGVFVVKLTLTDDGKECLETCSTSVGVCFPRQALEPGTIEKIVGPQRWQHFQEMKAKGLDQMFVDPQRPTCRAQAPRTW
ncbi:MAG: hypothetical protein V1789_09220 [PVC group bacterium]